MAANGNTSINPLTTLLNIKTRVKNRMSKLRVGVVSIKVLPRDQGRLGSRDWTITIHMLYRSFRVNI